MNRHRIFWVLVFCCLTVIVTGCGGGGGGGTSTAVVSGTVTYDGVAEADVTVQLVSLSTGAVAYSGVTDSIGQYTISGVAPGNYYAQYMHYGSSPYSEMPFYQPGKDIAQAVVLGSANTFNFINGSPPGEPGEP